MTTRLALLRYRRHQRQRGIQVRSNCQTAPPCQREMVRHRRIDALYRLRQEPRKTSEMIRRSFQI